MQSVPVRHRVVMEGPPVHPNGLISYLVLLSLKTTNALSGVCEFPRSRDSMLDLGPMRLRHWAQI